MATYTGKIFGRDMSVEYTPSAAMSALVALRVIMGWILFQGGIVKLLNPDWTAAGYLTHAIPEGNPFAAQFGSMAGSPVIDFLVPWGLTLTGIGLLVGALVRWNAFWAAFMMIMFWAASLTGGLAQGLPLEHGWVMDDHLVYTILLFALGAFGAGRLFGLDATIERSEFVKQNAWLKWLLG